MRRRKKRMKWAAVAILLLLIAVCLGLLTLRFQRIFMEYAINICEDCAIKEVGVLLEDEVFSHPEEFSNLVVLERDSDNRITALRTDVIAVGKIKARLVSGLFDRLDYLEETQIEVPLGTVFAPNLFTGMGPKVKVGLAGLTQMEAEFVSAFTSAGINQTRHRILIEVHAGFRILTPFGGEDREIVSTYPVTDTVIVGTVPERYAYIGSADGDLLGEIRDYDTDSDISRENRK
ncbi:sporulation protein YunB [uncultured Agathobaculum sp.]|uniref:sporulation protein YunB n=1 Tax=uncultured Agathobaculum sp. TaxID=2048140 RepID=UPI00296EBBC4